ncbi:hypothetical protein [Nonomuraea rosea]|uniref:hypothetical protein n=1 Tax=Nonomuraea rosea TaxID=638574 RepID=UPI0031EF4097
MTMGMRFGESMVLSIAPSLRPIMGRNVPSITCPTNLPRCVCDAGGRRWSSTAMTDTATPPSTQNPASFSTETRLPATSSAASP